MDHKRTENLFVTVSPGLEHVCARELTALEIPINEISTGGLSCSGKLRDIYLANLWLRTASRVLIRFAEFRSRDFPDLHKKAQRLPWGRFVKPETSVAFRITCQTSRLNHTQRISEALEVSINKALGRTTNPAGENPQMVLVRIVDDVVTLSIDSSGDLLHRRGYRQTTTRAPLRETLAAGALMLLGWTGDQALADPMCGSGSFPLEAALLAQNKAPGLNRNFAFQKWPGYREGLWTLLRDEAKRSEKDIDLQISGSDESADAIKAAQENRGRCGNSDSIKLELQSLSHKDPQPGNGLVICNPPYGKRLSIENPTAYYTELGKQLQRVYPGWRKAIICPDAKLVTATGLGLSRIAILDNGGLSVGLFATT